MVTSVVLLLAFLCFLHQVKGHLCRPDFHANPPKTSETKSKRELV